MRTNFSAIKSLRFRRLTHIALWYFAGAMFFLSCEEPVLTGTDLLTVDDNLTVKTLDTLQVITYTLAEDPLPVINPLLPAVRSTALLGSIDDPRFGQSFASFYTRLKLPTLNVNLGENLQFDSAFLSLRIVGDYGSNNTDIDIAVYQVDEAIDENANYLTDQTFQVLPTPIGVLTGFNPESSDSIVVDGQVVAPQARIRLDDDFARDLLLQLDDTSNFPTHQDFYEYLNGLYFTTNTSNAGDGVSYFGLQADESEMTIYYSQDTIDSLRYVIGFDENLAVINHFEHRYGGTDLSNLIADTVASDDSLIYLQSMAGTKVRIDIPNLGDLQNAAINKAELIFTVLEDQAGVDTLFNSPLELTLFHITSDGSQVLLPDLLFEGGSHFGGLRETRQINGQSVTQYSFNLTRYTQDVMSGALNNNGIVLQVFKDNLIADRSVLGGGAHSNRAPTFKLIYTDLK